LQPFQLPKVGLFSLLIDFMAVAFESLSSK